MRSRPSCSTAEKIRANKVEQGDAWTIVKDGKDKDLADLAMLDPVSPTPLPPQVANDPRKLAEAQRRKNMEGKSYRDDRSNPPTATTIAPYSTTNSVPIIDGSSVSVPQINADDHLAAERDSINNIHKTIMEELQAMRVQAKLEKERKDQDLVALSDKVTDNVNKMMEEMMSQVNYVLAEKLKEPPAKRSSSTARPRAGTGAA